MTRFKAIVLILFLVCLYLATLFSAVPLVIKAYLYQDNYPNVDEMVMQINLYEMTMLFYLTFGLAIITSIFTLYAYSQEDRINAAFTEKKE